MVKNIILSGLMLSALTLTACSEEKFEGDAPKDLDGNLMLFTPTDEANFSTYYMPEIGRVGCQFIQRPFTGFDQLVKVIRSVVILPHILVEEHSKRTGNVG